MSALLEHLFLSLPSPSRTNGVKILNVPPFHHHQLAESTQSSQRAEAHTSPSVTRSAAMALEKGLGDAKTLNKTSNRSFDVVRHGPLLKSIGSKY